jgi:2-aminoethylphosphonate dioxygenase
MLDTRSLYALTHTQVQAYQDDGYVVLPGLFPRDRVALLGQEADQIAKSMAGVLDTKNLRTRWKSHIETGEQVLEVLDPFLDLSSLAGEFVDSPAILNVLHDLYGEPAELFKDKMIYKPAGALGATLHQDWIGWPGFPETFLTVLVAIDEFNSESGATEVFSGIHKAGYLSPKDGQHYHLDADKLNGPAIPLLLEPGDVAIFGCFTPHRSAPNLSRQSRRGYFISYNAQSDGGNQYSKHYAEFHDWIRSRVPIQAQSQLYFK